MGFQCETDFNIVTFLQDLKATKPPYQCPFGECGKVYKSYNGIRTHLTTPGHFGDDGDLAVKSDQNGNIDESHILSSLHSPLTPRSPLSPLRSPGFLETQQVFDFEVGGKKVHININEPLIIRDIVEVDPESLPTNLVQTDTPQNDSKVAKVSKLFKLKEKNRKSQIRKTETETNQTEPKKEEKGPPEPRWRVIEQEVPPSETPTRIPASYTRYLEKSAEELDEEVEYDMDEEDHYWLQLINEDREKHGTAPVDADTFEFIMDRIEKESFFQSRSKALEVAVAAVPGSDGDVDDDDAICCVCNDGEASNSNVIMFCDMCNIPVHQECYGVPYIPEGQWLCRRCLHSPSEAVSCVLCPNNAGAFKQTNTNQWSHVICALWVPEISFANTVFLEPIENIDRIPSARWKLTCFICKQRNCGACIQCHRQNCYTAFHVTCAQMAGLYMKLEPVKEYTSSGTYVTSVRKTAFCDVHAPAMEMENSSPELSPLDKLLKQKELKEESRKKIYRARRLLAKKRACKPIVSIPTVTPNSMDKISKQLSDHIKIAKQKYILERILSYWFLKRKWRHGVPLIRRLQIQHYTKQDQVEERTMWKEHLRYWHRIRQDLEKCRLLLELVRKRERLKREDVKICQQTVELRIKPFAIFLSNVLDQLQSIDAENLFADPVNPIEVPTYTACIKHPMDFGTMRKKIIANQYDSFASFKMDFDLVVSNCLTFNPKETVFFRLGARMRDAGGGIMRQAYRVMQQVGFNEKAGILLPQPGSALSSSLSTSITSPANASTSETNAVTSTPASPPYPDNIVNMNFEEIGKYTYEKQIELLLEKKDYAEMKKQHPSAIRMIRKHLGTARRKLAMQNKSPSHNDDNDVNNDGSSKATAAAAPGSVVSNVVMNGEVSSDDGGGDGQPISPPAKRLRGSHPTTPQNTTPSSEKVVRSVGRGRHRKTPTTVSSPPTDACEHSHASENGSKSVSGFVGEQQSSNMEISQLSSTPSSASKGSGAAAAAVNVTSKLHIDTSSSPATAAANRAGISPHRRCPVSTSPRNNSSLLLTNGIDSPPAASGALLHRGDSFNMYRSSYGGAAGVASSSGSDTHSEGGGLHGAAGHTSDQLSLSPISTDMDDDGGDDDIEGKISAVKFDSIDDYKQMALIPLDLVWAKCKGYPWYPAMIIDPKMPRTGYFYNGMPIPVPPEEIMSMKIHHLEPLFLILFFDTKRTWNWLPRDMLLPLGMNKELDSIKFNEPDKCHKRKNVKQAYDMAMKHLERVEKAAAADDVTASATDHLDT